jgi:hypothetical protein
MIRKLRAFGRVLEFARRDPATAFVRPKPRSQAMPNWLRNHRPCKLKFTGHRRHTGGILSQISSNSMRSVNYDWIIDCPHDGSSEWP